MTFLSSVSGAQLAAALNATKSRFEQTYGVVFEIRGHRMGREHLEVSYQVGRMYGEVLITDSFLRERSRGVPGTTLMVNFLADVFFANLNSRLRMQMSESGRDYLNPNTFRFPGESYGEWLGRFSGAARIADGQGSSQQPARHPADLLPEVEQSSQGPRRALGSRDLSGFVVVLIESVLRMKGATHIHVIAEIDRVGGYYSWGAQTWYFNIQTRRELETWLLSVESRPAPTPTLPAVSSLEGRMVEL